MLIDVFATPLRWASELSPDQVRQGILSTGGLEFTKKGVSENEQEEVVCVCVCVYVCVCVCVCVCTTILRPQFVHQFLFLTVFSISM